MSRSTGALAIDGGTPVRSRPFPTFNAIGEEEKRAAIEVIESGMLSQFQGTWGPEFRGGAHVRDLEDAWREHFGASHAITMNSATSCLYAAIGSLDIQPGDEVIVPPYTMSASATGIVLYGGVPVFADILPDTFCLDPEAVRRAVTPRTKAIVVVHLFGHPAEMNEILSIAKERGIAVIEDAAQAPGAMYHGRPAGTLGNIGVFSLNRHKTIQCGEGGIAITNDDDLADRLRLIRNHAEVVVGDKGDTHLAHLIGFNYRLTEIEAAIAREQLRKLPWLTDARIAAANLLTQRLDGLRGITVPVVREHARHVYYMYVLRYDEREVGVHRDAFVRALRAEGIPVTAGYVRPIYLEPLYHEGRGSWRVPATTTLPSYERGSCPVTERMHFSEVVNTDLCRVGLSEEDADDIRKAIEKVLRHAGDLAGDRLTATRG